MGPGGNWALGRGTGTRDWDPSAAHTRGIQSSQEQGHEPRGPPVEAAQPNSSHSPAYTLSSSYEPQLLVPSSRAFCRRVNQGWARLGSSANVSPLLRTRPACRPGPQAPPGSLPTGLTSPHRTSNSICPTYCPCSTLALVQTLSVLRGGRTAAQLLPTLPVWVPPNPPRSC